MSWNFLHSLSWCYRAKPRWETNKQTKNVRVRKSGVESQHFLCVTPGLSFSLSEPHLSHLWGKSDGVWYWISVASETLRVDTLSIAKLHGNVTYSCCWWWDRVSPWDFIVEFLVLENASWRNAGYTWFFCFVLFYSTFTYLSVWLENLIKNKGCF